MKGVGRLIVVGLVAVAAVASGLHYVPPAADGFVVSAPRWGSGPPRLEPPGLRWAPPLVRRRVSYSAYPFPIDVNLPATADPAVPAPASREGIPFRLHARVTLAADPERFGDLLRRLGTSYRDPQAVMTVIAPAARSAAASIPYDRMLSGEGEARRGLMSAIEGAVKAAGLKLDRFLSLEAWPEVYPKEMDRSAEGRRVLIVGMDGADWSLIDPLMSRGAMPNLAALVAGGVRARLTSISPTLSPIVWTSIATGKRPEKHGIIDFLAVDQRTGAQIPVTSTMRRSRAFWGILSSRGISNGTVGWWATWPAEPVLGFLVSDRVAYQLFGRERTGEGLRGRTYPEALMLSLAPLVAEARLEAAKDLRELLGRAPSSAEPDEQALAGILESVRVYHRGALATLREYRPRVMSVYYEGTDTVAHLFMRYAPPRLPGVTAAQVERWGKVVERYYLLQDRLLGEVLAAAGPQTTVLIVSDHGFASGSTRPQTDPRIGAGAAADWHRKFGIFAAAGPGIARAGTVADLSVLDVTPTLLALLGLPAGEDMDGSVARSVLDQGAAAATPAAIATYEGEAAQDVAAAAPGGEAEAEVEREMIARLTALGYIGQTGANAENNTGVTLLHQGRHAEAAAAFRTALKSDPNFQGARTNLARALMAGGDYEGALAEIRKVLARDPNAPDVHNLTGNILMEKGDLKGAESTFREALERDPRSPHLWNSLGIVLARLGRPEEALAAYRRVIEIDPDYAEAINNVGLILRERGRLQEAIAEFRKAIAADAAFPGSYNNLGLTYQDMGDMAGATRAYDEGLKVDPENSIILNNKGSVLLATGRTAEAKEAFAASVASDPNYASAHNNLGASLGILGDTKGEFEEYLKAIELDPGYNDARFNLALNLLRQGKQGESERALQDLLGRDPKHSRALLQLGILQAGGGRTAEAARTLERARDSRPEWAPPHSALAKLYEATGRAEDAAREARASLAIDPNQPEISRIAQRMPRSTSGSRP